MSSVTEAFREHHRELAGQLSKLAAVSANGQFEGDPQKLAAFLKNELVPHAVGEERELYPVMDNLLRSHGSPTATMSVDHEYIQKYIAQMDALAGEFAGASAEERSALRAKLARLSVELQAIFALHLAKEERVYLPLFEQQLSAGEQQKVLDAMHETPESMVKQEVDVRMIPPPQRHPLIFGAFEALGGGEGFELVNDHDPKPLYYQFAAERTGEFTWDYIERGPQVWRVRIGKPPVTNRGNLN